MRRMRRMCVCDKECDKECAPGRRRAHGRGGMHAHSRWLSGVISDGFVSEGLARVTTVLFVPS